MNAGNIARVLIYPEFFLYKKCQYALWYTFNFPINKPPSVVIINKHPPSNMFDMQQWYAGTAYRACTVTENTGYCCTGLQLILTTLQCYNFTILQFYNFTTQPLYTIVTFRCVSSTVRRQTGKHFRPVYRVTTHRNRRCFKL